MTITNGPGGLKSGMPIGLAPSKIPIHPNQETRQRKAGFLCTSTPPHTPCFFLYGQYRRFESPSRNLTFRRSQGIFPDASKQTFFNFFYAHQTLDFTVFMGCIYVTFCSKELTFLQHRLNFTHDKENDI